MIVSPCFKLSDSGPLVQRLWLIFQHIRSDRGGIPTASHPDLASYNGGTRLRQSPWPWQGGEWSPGRCSTEEGEHRREVVSITTPSNDECLGGRKSSTGVGPSFLWQLGKFLDKAIDIVPCYVITISTISSGHHNRVAVGNPAGIISTVAQRKGFSTWQNLCIVPRSTISSAEQHDGVGK